MLKWMVFYNFCLSQVGTPYRLGASGKDGFWDCSGLMMGAGKEIGLSLYHGATTAYNRLVAAGYETGDIANLDRSRPALLFHQDSKNAKVMAHTGFQIGGKVVQSGGRWGKGTHTNPLYNSDWTKYVIPPQFEEEYDGEPSFPTLWGCGAGDWVATLQQQLEKLGYDVGGVDGKFGPITLATVKRFQTVNGLKADGIVGKDTVKKLFAAPAFLHTVTVKHCTASQVDKIKAICTAENEMSTEGE